MSKIEDIVVKKIQDRADVGKNKYGVTMEREDLTNLQWLQHAQEEAMDLCVYLEKLIQRAKTANIEDDPSWVSFLSESSNTTKNL